MKKCKICKKQFNPSKTTQVVCGLNCALKLAESKQGSIVLKRASQIEKKEAKIKLKTLGDFRKDLQIEVNKISRLIDWGVPCISCGTLTGQFQGGHYRSVGAWGNLRFNLHNIYGQCSTCNNHKSGNLIGFREGIIANYGQDIMNYIDDLNIQYPRIDLNKDELIEATKIARQIARTLNHTNKTYQAIRSAEDRILLRTIINQQLNIYK